MCYYYVIINISMKDLSNIKFNSQKCESSALQSDAM